ncbi:hypothetical protein sos41_25650 [Alphaproteobacteria bacterium SO-S41]|nr:hypothetical protein sos41_25650 [Alphaproteobacteria bacterium SO-S41]
MEVVVLVIHLFIALAMIGTILLQRSEGGALGIGGGGGAGGGLFSARGAANALTRTTAFLAAAFFVTSVTLSILARHGGAPTSIIDGATAPVSAPAAPAAPLDPLALPSSGPAPATPAPAPATQPATPPAEQPAAPAPAEAPPADKPATP